MNAFLLFPTCRQLSRGLSSTSKCIYKLPPFTSQQACFRTTSVNLFHQRISMIPEHVHEKLRKQYDLSKDYFVMYKEPKQELNHLLYAKYLELFLYGAPVWGLLYPYFNNMSLAEFASQQDFYIGVGLVCAYLLGIRFFVNGYVRIIFHNRSTDTYRAYVLNKYKPTYKPVDFKAEDLNVINLPPSFPMTRNFFRTGKQNLILHDGLFSSYNEQEKLIGEAIERWHAKWKK